MKYFFPSAFLLLLGFNLYDETTNSQKIRKWNEAITQEKLGGLSTEQAFLRLGKYGFKILDYKDYPRCDMNIRAPSGESIITLFTSGIPFSYCLKFDAQGNVLAAGWDK